MGRREGGRFFPITKFGQSVRLFEALVPLCGEVPEPIRLSSTSASIPARSN